MLTHVRTLLFITLTVAACGKDSTPAPTPSTAAVPSPKGPPEGDVAAAPSTPASTTRAGACRDGWSASVTEWYGMGSSTITVECKAGKATATVEDMEPRGDDVERATKPITTEVW